jgi:hypothetical protein
VTYRRATHDGTFRGHGENPREWAGAVAGFTEIDLVAHCGSFGDGEFGRSLNVTDIHAPWVETAPRGRALRRGHALAVLTHESPLRPNGLYGVSKVWASTRVER